VQKSDRDRGDNAQRDEDEECYAHANRECGGKRGLTGWDSHEPREPFVEFHSMSSFRIRRTRRRARIWIRRAFSRFMISQFQFVPQYITITALFPAPFSRQKTNNFYSFGTLISASGWLTMRDRHAKELRRAQAARGPRCRYTGDEQKK
jgi:hypothetical protein